MPKVSIIVPVYNTEKYLARCIDSILAQTFTDFELILVNDGSKDNSGKICDEYAQKDSRIIVIHKENGGVSSARNKGIDVAQGDWISFVDSDDWISSDFLSSFIYDADLIICGLELFGAKQVQHLPEEKRLQNKDEISIWLTSNYSKSYIPSQCSKLYRHDVIKKYNIRFNTTLIRCEDTLFNFEYLNYCNKIKLFKVAPYHYYIPNLDQTYPKYPISAQAYYNHINALYNSISNLENRFNKGLSFIKKSLFGHLLPFFYYYIETLSISEARKELREFAKYKLYKYCGKLTWKEYIYLRLITFSPSLFYHRR